MDVRKFIIVINNVKLVIGNCIRSFVNLIRSNNNQKSISINLLSKLVLEILLKSIKLRIKKINKKLP